MSKKFGWKTLAGALVWAVGMLTSPDIAAMLPADVSGVVQVVGAVLTVFGLRAKVGEVDQKVDAVNNRIEVPGATPPFVR
jgi:predicted membrane-bound spermidine synthase